jgi:hypothetical protein
MRLALALAFLVGCAGEHEPPEGWIRFDHELWWGYVPGGVKVRDGGEGFPRAITLGSPVGRDQWSVAVFDLPPDAVGTDPYVHLDGARNGFLAEGESLDAEQRTSVTIDRRTCPASRFRTHNGRKAQALIAFLCGRRLVYVAWRAPVGVDPDELAARRDLLLANIHLRD